MSTLAMDARTFHSLRRFADTPSGRIAYVEQGSGPVMLFLHGLPLNGFHWRHVMARLQDTRRCIALDLMGLGYSEVAPDQDLSFTAQARMVAQFLDTLGIAQVDLVGNDSGGGISQIFAVHHPKRLRTLTLTNCDTHDNYPSPSLAPLVEAARSGVLADGFGRLLQDREARAQAFAGTYADAESALPDEVFRVYAEPLLSSEARKRNFMRYWLSFDNAQTVAIEPRLRELHVPTQLVWATGDTFFPLKWAHWLQQTVPGAKRVVEVPDAKLFFAEERPQELAAALRGFVKVN